MDTQARHEMLAKPSHDEEAMQMFVKSLRGHLASSVAPGNKRVYEQIVVPEFKAANKREPADKYEVRKEMEQQPYYQFWSAMQRSSQELMWDTVIDTVERQLPVLLETADRLAKSNMRQGSLRLDPDLVIPAYHTGVDIHLQPGAYHTEHMAEDLSAGAIYDRGVYLYLVGGTGPKNDLLGRILLNYLKSNFPDFKPLRILDMGCAIGNSTVPWAEAFPQAEVHGIDVAAPVLRYGHARAETLGVPVHFSQQNAETTDFEGGSFDLVVSHIVLHETSHKAMPRVIEESERLLRPGGMMLHLDIPRHSGAFTSFMFDWEAYNNNEPFSRQFRESDIVKMAQDAGFADAHIADAPVNFTKTQRNYSADAFTGFPVLAGTKTA